jgi:hypothetical protein
VSSWLFLSHRESLKHGIRSSLGSLFDGNHLLIMVRVCEVQYGKRHTIKEERSELLLLLLDRWRARAKKAVIATYRFKKKKDWITIEENEAKSYQTNVTTEEQMLFLGQEWTKKDTWLYWDNLNRREKLISQSGTDKRMLPFSLMVIKSLKRRGRCVMGMLISGDVGSWSRVGIQAESWGRWRGFDTEQR